MPSPTKIVEPIPHSNGEQPPIPQKSLQRSGRSHDYPIFSVPLLLRPQLSAPCERTVWRHQGHALPSEVRWCRDPTCHLFRVERLLLNSTASHSGKQCEASRLCPHQSQKAHNPAIMVSAPESRFRQIWGRIQKHISFVQYEAGCLASPENSGVAGHRNGWRRVKS